MKLSDNDKSVEKKMTNGFIVGIDCECNEIIIWFMNQFLSNLSDSIIISYYHTQ
jgi:hypothetical protein